MSTPENTQPEQAPGPVPAPPAVPAASAAPAEPGPAEVAPEPEAPARPAWADALAAEVDAEVKAADESIESDLDRAAKAEAAFLAEIDASIEAARQVNASRHSSLASKIAGYSDANSRAISESVAQRQQAMRELAAQRQGTGAAA